MDIKHPLWVWGLFLFSAIYLGFELAFNSRLVDVASGTFSAAHVLAFEFEGRVLSGLGLTLLLLRKLKSNTPMAFIKSWFLISIFGFSSMFFGQKWLVNYLVDESTIEDRIDAQYITLLKKGILENSLQLDDLHIPEEELDTPATKAMVSIMGVMIFNSSSFIEQLKNNVDKIIDEAAYNDSSKALPEAYVAYQKYQQHTDEAWGNYSHGTQEYYRALSVAWNSANKKTEEIYLKAATEWKKANKQVDSKSIVRKSLEIKRAVNEYFDAKNFANNHCVKYKLTEQKCHIKIEQIYRDTVVKEAGKYVAPDYWCYPPEEKMVVKSIRGKKVLVASTIQNCQTMKRTWFEQQLLKLMPSGSTSFLSSRQVNQAVKEELSKQGINLPTNWTMHDKALLNEEIYQHTKEQVNQSYREQIVANVGEYLPPNLTQEMFIAHSLIQKPLKAETGWNKSSPMSLSLSPESFLEQVIKPKYVNEYQKMKVSLQEDGKQFANDYKKEEQGKGYYRAVIVPPLAMSFSLLFGILNLFAFTASMMAIGVKRPKIISASLVGITFVAYPLIFTSNTVESGTFKYFQEQLNQSYPSVLSHFSAWVVDTQPIVYPIGHQAGLLFQQKKVERFIINNLIDNTYLNEPTNEQQKHNEVSSVAENPYEQPLQRTPKNVHSITQKPASQISQAQLSNNRINNKVIRRQNAKSKMNWPHSLALLEESAANFDGIMFDLSPIGHPKDENWVVYDKNRFDKDVCILGRRNYDSLYHMSEAVWKTSMHGDCSDSWENGIKMPSVSRYIRKINQKVLQDQLIMISLRETITGEVYCQRYKNIINKLTSNIEPNNILFSTPSLSVLGCFEQLPNSLRTAFELPHFQKDANDLTTQNHNVLSMNEWRRIKRIESGSTITLREIPVGQLNELINNHPFLDSLLIDEQLLTKQVTQLLDEKSMSVFLMDNSNLIQRTFK